MTVRVAVLDYDAGNLRSAERALARAGADVLVTDDAARASSADALVVPGVGHFGQCVRRFRAAGFAGLVGRWQAEDRPLLGICVGMQILFASSEEAAEEHGLGLLDGRVVRLPTDVIVPHMGWNLVTAVRDDPLLEGVAGEQAYYVHSYHAEPGGDDEVVATCPYGPGFPSVVRQGSIVATQFHPEKSGAVGGRLLANFVRDVEGRG